MTEIIERAKEYCDKIFFNEIDKTCGFNGYIEGATEQHKIDVDKACEWLTERLQFGCHPCNGNNLVEEFRKVMDE